MKVQTSLPGQRFHAATVPAAKPVSCVGIKLDFFASDLLCSPIRNPNLAGHDARPRNGAAAPAMINCPAVVTRPQLTCWRIANPATCVPFGWAIRVVQS